MISDDNFKRLKAAADGRVQGSKIFIGVPFYDVLACQSYRYDFEYI